MHWTAIAPAGASSISKAPFPSLNAEIEPFHIGIAGVVRSPGTH
jgi:hypothetical protein